MSRQFENGTRVFVKGCGAGVVVNSAYDVGGDGLKYLVKYDEYKGKDGDGLDWCNAIEVSEIVE